MNKKESKLGVHKRMIRLTMRTILQAIEFKTTIDSKGNLQLPEKYREVYGKHVRLIVLWPETASDSSPGKLIDPMKYSNTLDWPVDGMEYQKQVR